MVSRALLVICALLTCPAVPAGAEGLLHVGSVRARESQAVVPVTLQGDVASGVASLNFQLSYDPNAVRLVAIDAGRAAVDTGKQIQWHETSPGRVNVVLTGFNQQTIQSGEIARLTVEPAQAEVRNARLNISGSTFASTEGDVIPSTGSTGALAWRIREEDDPDQPPAEPIPGAPAPPNTDPDPLPIPGAPAGIAGMEPPDDPEFSTASSLAASAERRLAAARERAEAIRPLLGASRADANDDSDPSETPAGDTGTVIHRAPNLRVMSENGLFAPDFPVDSTITPEKKLENTRQRGHNRDSFGVLGDKTTGGFMTAVLAAVGTLMVVTIVSIIRGHR